MRNLTRRFGTALLAAVAIGAVTIIAQEGRVPPSDSNARDANLAAITKSPYRFTVTNSGRVVNIQIPVGTTRWFDGQYELCTGTGNYQGSDDFNLVSIDQTNGPGTLPLSVTARTFDNNWQIKWSYKVDNVESELSLTANIKRLFSPTTYAYLEVGGDVFAGSSTVSLGVDANNNTVWWERTSDNVPLTMSLPSTQNVGGRWAWIATGIFSFDVDDTCFGGYASAVPLANVDRSGIATYYFGSIASGVTRKAEFKLRKY